MFLALLYITAFNITEYQVCKYNYELNNMDVKKHQNASLFLLQCEIKAFKYLNIAILVFPMFYEHVL